MSDREKVVIRLDNVMPGLKMRIPKDTWEEQKSYGQLMLKAKAEGTLDDMEMPSVDSEGRLYYDGSGRTWGEWVKTLRG